MNSIIVLHESLFASIVRDVATFGSIGLLLYANAFWLGDHASVAVLLVLMAVVAFLAHSQAKQIYDKEEAHEYIDSLNV